MRPPRSAPRPAPRRRTRPSGGRAAPRWRAILGFRRADALWLRDRLAPCFVLGCVTAAFWFLLQSPLFVVRSVHVLGASGGLAEQVATSAGIADVNLFALNPAQIRARVAGIPDLQRVGVRLHLPNTLTIQVTTYQPAAVWISAGASYLITAGGLVIKPGDVPDLVHLTAADGKPLSHGDQVDANAVRSALALRGMLDQQRLEAQRYTFLDARSLQVTSPAGWQATFDVTGDLATQVRVLTALLARGVQFHAVDLRYGDTPYYR